MGKSARGLGILALLSLPAVAFAQQPPANPAPQQQPQQGQAPAATGTGTAAAPDKPKGDPGGYTYSDKPAVRTGTVRRAVAKSSGPVATLPGFEQTTDGGSRLFVQLTQNVQVEERKAQGSITYVLKGAHVNKWNNTNALVTVHFNTPVWRARLVPQGKDLLFIIDLRAQAAPTFKMADAADHTSMLTVDFAKGDYSNVAAPTDAPAATPEPKAQPQAAPATKPAPKQ